MKAVSYSLEILITCIGSVDDVLEEFSERWHISVVLCMSLKKVPIYFLNLNTVLTDRREVDGFL